MNWIILPVLFGGALLWYGRKGYLSKTRGRRSIDKAKPAGNQYPEILSSTDLEALMNALSKTTDNVARHDIYHRIIELTYPLRKDETQGKIFFEYARNYMAEYPKMHPALDAHFQGEWPEIPAFKKLAIALEEIEAFDEALAVCNLALKYNLDDGTKTGFYGRINRIEKKKYRNEEQ